MRPFRAISSRSSRPRSRLGLGGLTLISVFFISSGSVRLADLDRPAISAAVSWVPLAQAEPDGHAGLAADDHGRPPEDVIDALRAREAALNRRERALEERAHALDLVAEEVAAQMEALATAEASLRETLALADGAAKKDLERLTRMYETMKPKEAAALFETMDPTFAAGFLGQMTPAAAAEIMSGLSPSSAYTISLVLAGRNMQVPTE